MCSKVKDLYEVLEENVQSEHQHVTVSMRSKTTSNSPLALKTLLFLGFDASLHFERAAPCARCDCAKSTICARSRVISTKVVLFKEV